jgi:hypothetical protein
MTELLNLCDKRAGSIEDEGGGRNCESLEEEEEEEKGQGSLEEEEEEEKGQGSLLDD